MKVLRKVEGGGPLNYAGKIVIYNRIPKTGSTTLTNAIGYDLCKINEFNAIHLNLTKNKFSMNLIDQSEFITNITTWKEKLPAFYHGHVAFIDFTRFGLPNPIYINLIREPLERLLSHFYFLRYGDNYRVGLKRSKAGHNETFDECIEMGGKDCEMKQIEPGNEMAMKQAKWNLVNRYLVVGLNERMEDLIAVLEKLLPSFFKGAFGHFKSLSDDRAHLRYTNKKIPPNEATLSKIHSDLIYKMEKEFYDFAKAEFENIWQKIHNEKTGEMLEKQFHYEKIKP
uniref:Sulfotransferase family protein n=1 Tax=Panagrolaimus sp. ES5 TaxID=591445 RepID=A0AC34GV92_9BILA